MRCLLLELDLGSRASLDADSNATGKVPARRSWFFAVIVRVGLASISARDLVDATGNLYGFASTPGRWSRRVVLGDDDLALARPEPGFREALGRVEP